MWLLSTLFFVFTAFADPCQTQQTLDRQVRIEMLKGASVTVVSEARLPEAEEKFAVSLFLTEASSPEETVDSVKQLLSRQSGILQQAQADLKYLGGELQSKNPPSYIVLALEDGSVQQWQKLANILAINAWAKANSRRIAADWDNLMLVTLGPALFLKIKRPDLFAKVTVEGFSEATLKILKVTAIQSKTNPWLNSVVTADGAAIAAPTEAVGNPFLRGGGVLIGEPQEMQVLAPAVVNFCNKLQQPAAEAVASSPTAALDVDSGARMQLAAALGMPKKAAGTTALLPRADDAKAADPVAQTSATPTPTSTEAAVKPTTNIAPKPQRVAFYVAPQRVMSRRAAYIPQTESGVDPGSARRLAVQRHAFTYSWVTYVAGRRYVHIRPLRR